MRVGIRGRCKIRGRGGVYGGVRDGVRGLGEKS